MRSKLNTFARTCAALQAAYTLMGYTEAMQDMVVACMSMNYTVIVMAYILADITAYMVVSCSTPSTEGRRSWVWCHRRCCCAGATDDSSSRG